jgi:hypothetical protein
MKMADRRQHVESPIGIEYRILDGSTAAQAVFHIPLPNGSTVFMQADPRSDRTVVVVSANALLATWRAEPDAVEAPVANGNPLTWMNDSEFHWPAAHFAQGIVNPVPLAYVGFRLVHKRRAGVRGSLFRQKQLVPSVNFGDGITRTIWLLTQGAERFPVHCTVEHARLLAKHCGVTGMDSIVTLTPPSIRFSSGAAGLGCTTRP